jgi:competence protein ComEC
MNERLRLLRYLFGGVLIFGLVCILLQPATSAQDAKIFMLDIGQGDSFLIQSANGKQILIDGGRDAQVLSELAKVMPRGDRSIDIVIATHPDADHIGGLPEVIKRYRVGLFLTSQVVADTEIFASLYEILKKKHIPSYYGRHGMMFTLDEKLPTTFSILFPDRNTSNWETNTTSIVGRLDIGEVSALFTGDSPVSVEHFLRMSDAKAIDVDILKLGHHGSKTSSSEEFLKATTPELALISAGISNHYGHPHKEVISRLEKLGIPWVSTQERGTVTLSINGKTWVETDEK